MYTDDSCHIGVRLRGRTVVVIGSSETAYSAVLELPDHGPLISVIAPNVTPAIAGRARNGELTLGERVLLTTLGELMSQPSS
jgi:siroheme synthase (precorrin-2 oxidase/ferrochelatase)